ncbi:putative bifunctional diguanylate cyclase/phosphodiesterase [Clostridium cylindrosporum]|uniref:Signaling protein n=1 Tax=Clostridium cylindrosporum DSM 605 TaxID=1121307 RepID=A0A0J8DCA5_CLOCY|nr:EAL domain-containing protein [Clostridium cylindrosporum]KMT21934.1 signaling protein [Clostridium cylindrosporum DSM 605]
MKLIKKDICKIVVLLVVFIIYVIGLIYKNHLIGYILSPLVAFFATLIIFNVYRKSNNIAWLVLLLSGTSWVIADMIWGYYAIALKLKPQELLMFDYIYMIPGLFILGSLILLFKNKMGYIEKEKLIIDVLTIVILLISIFWIMILKRQFQLKLKTIQEIIILIYITIDFAIISVLCLNYLSFRPINVKDDIRYIYLGALTYFFADICLEHQWINGTYTPNSIVDGGFILAFVIFAVGGLIETSIKEKKQTYEKNENKVVKSVQVNSWIMLGVVIILYLLGGLDNLVAILMIVVIFTHRAASSYIKNQSINKKILEEKIEEKTRSLSESNEKLSILLQHDSMSGLYNRRYFIEKLEVLISEKKAEEVIAVLFIDLDRFKAINDYYGHDMGDNVLKIISSRLKSIMPEDTLLARLGGDEFVIAKSGIFENSKLELFVKKMIETCKEPIIIEPYNFNISMSVGIATTGICKSDRGILMKNADIAMYDAKECVSKNYSFYNQELHRKIERKNKLELLLKRISFDKEFEVYYQPQFKTKTKELVGIEALVRWSNSKEGSISPREFIPIAEESNLIVKIGSWVMKKAIEQVSKWNRDYNKSLRVGINISPKQMDSIDFVSNLKEIVKKTDMNPNLVDIEITESVAMDKGTGIKNVLNKLSEEGFIISVDDFGTGYSSLGYIKRYDIDRLKIAKELIDNISIDEVEFQIVEAIIMMARSMKIETIAEGVEKDWQLERLRDLGCDEVQGYIWEKPLTVTEFEKKYLN